MFNSPIITVKNIGKEYDITHHKGGYVALRDILTNIFKNPFASLKTKTKEIMGIDTKEKFWALKDINFEVKRGEVIGIIGRNGAGKSTLLKILSQITPPTTGEIKINGTVGSLLEVGTGFHPELTGRENIFLNGAILGMKKKEIIKKFNEIVEFAGIEKFLDTPVKYYSSGMYVRLAFSVAAHMDTDILIIDEVLAVGDSEFQKKCLNKMEDITQKEGRTILFVSHNMTAIKSLCKLGILLEDGSVKFAGKIEKAIDFYLSGLTARSVKNNFWEYKNAPGNDNVKVKSAFISHINDKITVKNSFDIITEFWNLHENAKINVSMVIWDINQNPVFNISTDSILLRKGLNKAIFHIPENFMNDGVYSIKNYFVQDSTPIFIHENACAFEIFEDRINTSWQGKWIGAVRPTFIKSDLYPINTNNAN